MLEELLLSVHMTRQTFQGQLGFWYTYRIYSFKEFGVLDEKTEKKHFTSGLMGRDWFHLLQFIIEN